MDGSLSLFELAAVAAASALLAWIAVALARRKRRTGWPWAVAVMVAGVGPSALDNAPTTLELALAGLFMSTMVAIVPLAILIFVPTARRA